MKKFAVFVLMVMLAGCFGGTSGPSHFYRLKMLPGSPSPVSQKRLEIGVEEAVVPQYLDRPQIVTAESGSSELKISEFERWAEPLSAALARTLADDLSLYLPQSVVKYKTLGSENFTYALTLELNRLEAVPGKELTLDIWWTVYKNGRLFARDRSRQTTPLAADYENLADELSRLVGVLAQQIAEKLAG